MTGFVADYWDGRYGILKNSLYFNEKGELIYRKSFDSLGNHIQTEGAVP